MGCASSTEVITDPVTGKEKKKKTLGGHYPGNRPPTNAPYRPSDFNDQGQATAHFVAYGGGNALQLQQTNGKPPTNNYSNGSSSTPEYIQVTLPPGVQAGQTVHVQAPDGRLNAIVIPPGFGAGSTFTVEFAKQEEEPLPTAPSYHKPSLYGGGGEEEITITAANPPNTNSYSYNPYDHSNNNNSNNNNSSYQPQYNANPYQHQQQQQQHQQQQPDGDDGFASGFGRR